MELFKLMPDGGRMYVANIPTVPVVAGGVYRNRFGGIVRLESNPDGEQDYPVMDEEGNAYLADGHFSAGVSCMWDLVEDITNEVRV